MGNLSIEMTKRVKFCATADLSLLTGSCGFFLSNVETMLVRMGETCFCRSGLIAKMRFEDSDSLFIVT